MENNLLNERAKVGAKNIHGLLINPGFCDTIFFKLHVVCCGLTKKTNLDASCGGECMDGAVDVLLLRLFRGLGNGKRNSDDRSLDDVLCRSIDAADARFDMSPRSVLSSENRLLVDRRRPPESALELSVENRLLDERSCPVDCTSYSGVVRVDDTVLLSPLDTLVYSAVVTGVTEVRRDSVPSSGGVVMATASTECRVTERRAPPPDDTELTSAKSPDDIDFIERFTDTGLTTSSCVSNFSCNFLQSYSHISQQLTTD